MVVGKLSKESCLSKKWINEYRTVSVMFMITLKRSKNLFRQDGYLIIFLFKTRYDIHGVNFTCWQAPFFCTERWVNGFLYLSSKHIHDSMTDSQNQINSTIFINIFWTHSWKAWNFNSLGHITYQSKIQFQFCCVFVNNKIK